MKKESSLTNCAFIWNVAGGGEQLVGVGAAERIDWAQSDGRKVSLLLSDHANGGRHLVFGVLLHALGHEKDARACRKEEHEELEEANAERLVPLGREDLAECVDFEASQHAAKVSAANAARHSDKTELRFISYNGVMYIYFFESLLLLCFFHRY